MFCCRTKNTCHHLVLSHPLRSKPPLSKKRCDNTIYRFHFLLLTSSPTSAPTSSATSPLYHLPCLPRQCQVSFHTPTTRQRLRHANVIPTKAHQKPAKIKFVLKMSELSCFVCFSLFLLCNLCMVFYVQSATSTA